MIKTDANKADILGVLPEVCVCVCVGGGAHAPPGYESACCFICVNELANFCHIHIHFFLSKNISFVTHLQMLQKTSFSNHVEITNYWPDLPNIGQVLIPQPIIGQVILSLFLINI